MPSWNIHLEADNRLVKRFKLSGTKRKKFLLSCLLPDINNGYVNQVKTKKRLDNLLEDTIGSFSNDYLKENHA